MVTNKTKRLWWVITLLALLNITTIVTIIINNHSHIENENKIEETLVIDPESRPINGKYFRHELGFDNSQMEVFRQSNRKFRKKANLLVDSIYETKQLMFHELQIATPDTIKLHQLSARIGSLHAGLKDATVEFYLSLSKVCNTEQQEKMKEIFTPLFINIPVKRNGNGGENCKNDNIN